METKHIQNIEETDESYIIEFGKSEEDISEFLDEENDRALSDIDTVPTDGMVSEAKKGLEWRREFGRGGTAVGIARARSIANKQKLSISTVKRMYSFFSRHEVDKQAEGFSAGEDGYPSNGRIAWALWGGDAGFSWAKKKVGQIKNEEEKDMSEEIETKENKTPMKLERVFHLDKSKSKAYDEDKRTVDLAFSSEEPYPRSFGMEVLSHKMDDVDMKFLQSGNAPLLLDHDATKQIGVIENASISENDKVGRATVRFGNSNLAREVFQDIVDGIRKNISVGYEVTNMVKMERKKEDEMDSYRVSWRPLEVSSVSIPADTTVGVGRSRQEQQQQTKEKKTMDENVVETPKVEKPSVDVRQITEDARKEEVARIKEISALGAKHNCSDLAEKAMQDGNSVAEFRGIVLNHIGNAKPLEQKADELGLSKKEARDYSLAKAIKAMATKDWSNAQLEKEASEEIAKRSGKTPRGVFVPSDVSWYQRDLTQGTASAGGNLVATDLLAGSYVDALRSASYVREAGATVLSGLQGDVAIPAANATTTAYWVAENGAPTEGAPTYRQISMNPKTVAAYVDISRHLMMQSTPAIETIVRTDVITGLANAVDKAAIQGTGSSNQPTGVINQSGIGSVALGTNGGAATYGDIVDLWKEVATDNALLGNLSFFTSPLQASRLMQTVKVSSTDSVMIMNDRDSLLGYKLYTTTNVPDNLTKGTSSGDCSAIVFGNWGDLFIAEWGNLDVMVDPYSLSTQAATRIAAFYDIDIAVRHAESFSAILDANA